MSTAFNAGLDTSDVELSYGEETVWSAKPAVSFQAVRLNSEGFSETKTRSRPGEIRSTGDAAHAVTQGVEASGNIAAGLSYDTFHDLLEGLVNGTWGTAISLDSSGVDYSAVASGNKFTSTNSGAFDNFIVGQWVKVGTFAINAVNNGYFQVTAIVTGGSPEMAVSGATLINETSTGAEVNIQGRVLRNGTDIHSYYFQKKLAASIFLNYPGSYVSGGSITTDQGNFAEVSFDFICQQELKATSDSSTGAVTAAPSGRVFDTVAGFNDFALDGAAPTQILQSVNFAVTKEGARAQYGVGSAAAQGMGRGTITLNGSVSIYFTNFDLYDIYKAETDSVITYRVSDTAGNDYIITLPAATLMNPTIVAGGPDTDILAEFELEGNAAETGDYSGITIQIDKFDAV